MEYEKIDSQKLQYWSLILKEDDKHFVVLIPRGSEDNHKKAKDWIEKAGKLELAENENGTILYHFKSLTLRALEKLCFKKYKNTFINPVVEELTKNNEYLKNRLDQKIQDLSSKSYFKKKNDYQKSQEVIKRLISGLQIKAEQHKIETRFYQDILKTNYARTVLDIVDFGNLQNVLNGRFDTLQDFEKELEKSCYLKKPYILNENQKQYLINSFKASIFEITSYDLKKERKNPEKHTQIWQNFWSNENKSVGYLTRLNPEISIFYREANQDLKDQIRAGEIDFPKKLKEYQNRFKKEHFTLKTTISLNATYQKTDLAFKTTQDILDYIQEFNNGFSKDFKGNWFYGIDRGLNELATLCVVKFDEENKNKNKNEFGVSKPKEFAKIEVLEIKDLNKKKEIITIDDTGNKYKRLKKVADNISYFIDQEDLFDKKTVSCIDLTTAKLIKNKIVLNGDVNTYYKLKDLSAKRRLWELFYTKKLILILRLKQPKKKLKLYVMMELGFFIIYMTMKNKIKIN